MLIPKEVGRIYKPFDLFGWFMAILGLVMMAYFGGLFKTPPDWWLLAASFLCFWEYTLRVAYGRIYRIVYYDTIIHNLYEIRVDNKTFYVNAYCEEDLAHYINSVYPGMEYHVVETHTESFIRLDKHC
jgi:hypothetical protein